MTGWTPDDTVQSMTLAEKIGQMTQVSVESITPAEIADLGIGSILSGGDGNPDPNTPERWSEIVSEVTEASTQSRTGVPIVYGVDAVHGHSNVRGATIFPHNIGLGAARDVDLAREIARATAAEMRATGIRWAFAPAVSLPLDIRWGRTYEGFGQDPDLVAALANAQIEGFQGSGPGIDVLACAKHFVADGATEWGTASKAEWVGWWDGWGDAWQMDQGDSVISAEEMFDVHLLPYRDAVKAGVGTVMASYSSWNGQKMHGNAELLTNTLKLDFGFNGFVISDWMGVDQLDPDYEKAVIMAINAGVDMVMVPDDYKRFISAMKSATQSGAIPLARVDEAVTRILRIKDQLRTHDTQAPDLRVVGSKTHQDIARRAVAQSAVLLTSRGGLPVPPEEPVVVAGVAADDIGLQCGGWSVGWQGNFGASTPGQTLLEGLLQSHDSKVTYSPDGTGIEPTGVGIVCLAEPPYAEGPGDKAVPSLTDEDLAVFERVRSACEKVVLVIYSGRPLVMDGLLDRADSVIAAWLPGTEAGALSDLVLGRKPFKGKTPQPWPASAEGLGSGNEPALFPVGHGLTL